MQSKWRHLKQRAVTMRKGGASIRDIETRLCIPRSTLSGWMKAIHLSSKHRQALALRYERALDKARSKASLWHNEQKAARLVIAETAAKEVSERLVGNQDALELALAMLYLGEGSKSQKGLVLGNSNPIILKFFISALRQLYTIEPTRLRCELHLRADQKPTHEVTYWSDTLLIPTSQFKASYLDTRTIGKKTYDSYHGVCVVSYGDVAIQRKLMYLYQLYCLRVIHTMRA